MLLYQRVHLLLRSKNLCLSVFCPLALTQNSASMCDEFGQFLLAHNQALVWHCVLIRATEYVQCVVIRIYTYIECIVEMSKGCQEVL